jgi:proliferating cell nuclear antigen
VKKVKKTNTADDDSSEGGVHIEMNQHVNLTFSLKYLVNFAKSAALSQVVQLMMSNDVPLLVRLSYYSSY